MPAFRAMKPNLERIHNLHTDDRPSVGIFTSDDGQFLAAAEEARKPTRERSPASLHSNATGQRGAYAPGKRPVLTLNS